MVTISALTKVSNVIWDLPISHKEGMLVPARIFATRALIEKMDVAVFDQISNVATLPGTGGHHVPLRQPQLRAPGSHRLPAQFSGCYGAKVRDQGR